MSSILESVWPGLWNAVQVIINPRLDRYVMNDREKETVRKALGDKPKERLTNAGWMLKAVDTIRNIAVGTKSEVYQIGAESAINYLVKNTTKQHSLYSFSFIAEIIKFVSFFSTTFLIISS